MQCASSRRPPRTARRAAAGACAAVVLGATLLLLAGCTAGGESADPAPSGTASTGAGADLPVDAAAVREQGTPVTSAGVTLSVAVVDGGLAATDAEEDDTTRVLVSVAPGTGDAASVAIAAPEGATLDVQADKSVVVRDGTGAFVAGLSVPHATAGDGGTRAPRVQVAQTSDDAVVTWTVTGSGASTSQAPAGDAAASDAVVTAELAASTIRSATWREIDDEGGRSLAVVPTTWARSASSAASEGLWTQLVAMEPEADTGSMHDQLTCHTIGAPDKDSWNLEPWRPDVGLLAVIAAYCNPS